MLLALLLACARSQSSSDDSSELGDSSEFDSLVSEIDATLTFPDRLPIVVGRNKVGIVGRAVSTSALPFWALAVLAFCGAVVLVAVGTLVFSLCSSSLAKNNKTFGVVLSICLLVVAAAGITTALAVGYSLPTSNGLQPGSRFVVDSAVARVVSAQDGNLWRIVVLDSSGEETTTFYYVEDAGTKYCFFLSCLFFSFFFFCLLLLFFFFLFLRLACFLGTIWQQQIAPSAQLGHFLLSICHELWKGCS